MKDYYEVFTTYANLIGYSRVILALIAFYVAFDSPILFTICYSTSSILDGFDGWAARKYNQCICTQLGVVLDMITDRFCTALVLLVLSQLYPAFRFPFMFFLALDFCSHWLQMYSTIKGGEAHHKNSTTRYWLLRQYYGKKSVLFTLVLGSEAFYISYYLYAFKEKILPPAYHFYLEFIVAISAILFLIKMVMNIVQLMSASEKLADLDIKKKD